MASSTRRVGSSCVLDDHDNVGQHAASAAHARGNGSDGSDAIARTRDFGSTTPSRAASTPAAAAVKSGHRASVTARIGIANGGFNCFAIAVLRALFAFRPVVNCVKRARFGAPHLQHVQHIFALLAFSTPSTLDLGAFFAAVARLPGDVRGARLKFPAGAQHDAHEFMMMLVDEIGVSAVGWTLAECKECGACGAVTEPVVATHPCLVVPITGPVTVQELVERDLRGGGTTEGVMCSACGQTGDAVALRTLDAVAPHVVVQLGRFEYQHASAKITTRVDLADTLVVATVVGEVTLRLTGVVSHIGASMHGGHYVCYTRDGATWWRYNDSRVDDVPFDRVGGHRDSGGHCDETPYLLLYEQDNAPRAVVPWSDELCAMAQTASGRLPRLDGSLPLTPPNSDGSRRLAVAARRAHPGTVGHGPRAPHSPPPTHVVPRWSHGAPEMCMMSTVGLPLFPSVDDVSGVQQQQQRADSLGSPHRADNVATALTRLIDTSSVRTPLPMRGDTRDGTDSRGLHHSPSRAHQGTAAPAGRLHDASSVRQQQQAGSLASPSRVDNIAAAPSLGLFGTPFARAQKRWLAQQHGAPTHESSTPIARLHAVSSDAHARDGMHAVMQGAAVPTPTATPMDTTPPTTQHPLERYAALLRWPTHSADGGEVEVNVKVFAAVHVAATELGGLKRLLVAAVLLRVPAPTAKQMQPLKKRVEHKGLRVDCPDWLLGELRGWLGSAEMPLSEICVAAAAVVKAHWEAAQEQLRRLLEL